MVPNLLNTLVGVLLVYAATLDSAPLHDPLWLLPGIGVVIILLALWARAGDPGKWYSMTNTVLGLLLLVLAGLQYASLASALLMFWGVFWVGILVAVIALWAALYRPAVASSTL